MYSDTISPYVFEYTYNYTEAERTVEIRAIQNYLCQNLSEYMNSLIYCAGV